MVHNILIKLEKIFGGCNEDITKYSEAVRNKMNIKFRRKFFVGIKKKQFDIKCFSGIKITINLIKLIYEMARPVDINCIKSGTIIFFMEHYVLMYTSCWTLSEIFFKYCWLISYLFSQNIICFILILGTFLDILHRERNKNFKSFLGSR